MSELTYIEPSRKLKVNDTCDVLVIGGGTAGVVAALAAARTGAKTILVERYGFLGGTMLGGACGIHSYFNVFKPYGREKKQVVQGIPGEIADRMIARGACPGHIEQERGYDQFSVVTTFDREAYKLLSLEMMEEAGVILLLHTFCASVIMDGNNIKGVIVESKGGREVILANCVIDCSGDADVAYMAGCELVQNIEPYDVGMVFAMANVDIPRLEVFMDENGVLDHIAHGEKGGTGKDKVVRLAGKFSANPHLKKQVEELGIWGMYTFSCHEGELTYINGSRVPALKDTSSEEMTRAEIQSRKKINEMAKFFIKSFPGFENAYVSWTCAQIGIRRTRVIKCEHDLSSEEIDSGARFDDEIGLYGFHDMGPLHVIDINPYLHSGVKSSIIGTTYYDGGLQYGRQKSRKIQKKNTLG